MRSRKPRAFELRRQLPRLRRTYTNGRKLDTPDEETHILLEAGLMRDWTNARLAVRRSKKTPLELFWLLTKKRPPDYMKRFRLWLIRLTGAYPYDPHKRELQEIERR